MQEITYRDGGVSREFVRGLEADIRSRLQRRFTDAIADPNVAEIRTVPKIGRNEPCPCGSGKKFKHCCIRQTETLKRGRTWALEFPDDCRPEDVPDDLMTETEFRTWLYEQKL